MYSVILTEIIQLILITIVLIAFKINALDKFNPQTFNVDISRGLNHSPFHWKLNLDRSHIQVL